MRSLKKKVLEGYRAQHWAPGDIPTSGVRQRRRRRQSSFLWIPLTLENQSRGHVFLEHLLQSLYHTVSGFLEFSVLVASSSLLHKDRTGEDLCTSRPQGWPRGNSLVLDWDGWSWMDGLRRPCMSKEAPVLCCEIKTGFLEKGCGLWAGAQEPRTTSPQPPRSLGQASQGTRIQNLSLALQAATNSYLSR